MYAIYALLTFSSSFLLGEGGGGGSLRAFLFPDFESTTMRTLNYFRFWIKNT